MVTITSQEIAQYRSQLSAYPEALKALDVIEDCEGDVEDAAISLAIQAGQQPDTSDNWLALLAKRCRVAICEQEFREDLLNGNCTAAVEYLVSTKLCPELLVTPVVIYVMKTGVKDFCEPLEYKL
jgi:hypothetical protein